MSKPLQKRLDDRVRWLQAGAASEHRALSEHQKAAVLRLTEEGATLIEIATLEGMPSVSSIYREALADAVFADALNAARAASATTAIEEAQHNLRVAATGKDTDEMIIAASYHRGTLDYAAKIAPKEYGQLVKLAGADGGALTVRVISYGTTQDIIGGSLESKAALTRDAVYSEETQEISATPEG